MDEERLKAYIDKIKEETKAELRSEFQEQITKQQEQIAKQQEKLDDVTAYFARLSDPRLAFFTSDEPSSAGSKAISNPILNQHRLNQKAIALQHGSCMGCGGDGSNSHTGGLTCAHIIPNTGKKSDYDVWNTTSTIANYSSDIDPYSSANLLVLCGTKGEQGTCHDAYDKHIMSLYYNVDGGDYIWWVRRPEFKDHKGMDLHNKHVAIADPKYRRLLAWRTLAASLMAGPSRTRDAPEKSAFVDMLQKSEEDEML